MIRIALITSAAAAAALAAYANTGDMESKFATMDTDADGVVTEAEFVSYKTADGEYTVMEASEKFAMIAGDDAELTEVEYDEAVDAWEAEKAGSDWTEDSDLQTGEDPLSTEY
mgnify:CR=1 FL=1